MPDLLRKPGQLMLLLAIFSSATACASWNQTSSNRGDLSPAEVVHTQIQQAVGQGQNATDQTDYYTFKGRTNPVMHCGAPPHELRIHGRWQRVKLSGSEKVLKELRTKAPASLHEYDFKITGYPDGSLQVFGQVYPEIVVDRLVELR